MHHITRRLLPSVHPRTRHALAALAAAAALGVGAAPAAHAAAPGVVSVNADGMAYNASAASSEILISQAGDQLIVDDTLPLVAGAGCAPFPGDATKASCSVPAGKRFEVNAGDGDDTIRNLTQLGMVADGGLGDDHIHGGNASGSAASLDDLRGGPGDDVISGHLGNDRLIGGSGNDLLNGGSERDQLFGQSGDDTLHGDDGDEDYLDGGIGDDKLDGGAGEHDLVTYEFRTGFVSVGLPEPGAGFSAGNGATGESDQIANVEDVRGGQDDDFIMGNSRDNQLESFVGANSVLIGGKGADVLVGGDGSDRLFAGSPFFPGFVSDGARDRVFGGNGDDVCSFSLSDPDFAADCE